MNTELLSLISAILQLLAFIVLILWLLGINRRIDSLAQRVGNSEVAQDVSALWRSISTLQDRSDELARRVPAEPLEPATGSYYDKLYNRRLRTTKPKYTSGGNKHITKQTRDADTTASATPVDVTPIIAATTYDSSTSSSCDSGSSSSSSDSGSSGGGCD